MTTDVDVLIIGSGPAGATYARTLTSALPDARMLMIEAGPRLTPRAGVNVATLTDPEQRTRAQQLAQGPARGEARSVWPGTHVIGAEGGTMPAASVSTGVGGMGAHWNCVTPRPWGPERIGYWPEDEWDDAIAAAERLLGTATGEIPRSPWGQSIRDRLSEMYHATLPHARAIGELPVALTRTEDGRLGCAGVDTILGPLANPVPTPDTFELRAETVCRRVLVDGDTATGAIVVDRRTGVEAAISAAVVVVAADALRTPQLLWASSIRPPALGRYLNDQPQVVSSVIPAADLACPTEPTGADARDSPLYPLVDTAWVPFAAPQHPYHGQVMVFDGGLVVMSWFCRKEIRADDRLEFTDGECDEYGLPRIGIRYALTTADHETVSGAVREQTRIAQALGAFAPGAEPALLPAGSSLHYQGTVRMGLADDGRSVCDPSSRVWAYQNLYLGGNGVIPTATACNPTLTTVALALLSCRSIVRDVR